MEKEILEILKRLESKIDGVSKEYKDIYIMINKLWEAYEGEIKKLSNEVAIIRERLDDVEKVAKVNSYEIAKLKI